MKHHKLLKALLDSGMFAEARGAALMLLALNAEAGTAEVEVAENLAALFSIDSHYLQSVSDKTQQLLTMLDITDDHKRAAVEVIQKAQLAASAEGAANA